MADTALLGVVGPLVLPWPASSPAYDASKNSQYAFDLDKARSLLGEAGVSDLELDFLWRTANPEYGTMIQIYQSDLAQIGVKLNLVTLEGAAFGDALFNQKYRGFYGIPDTAWAGLEPATAFSTDRAINYLANNSGFQDDAYTKLVKAAQTEPDPTKRKQQYSELNDYLLDQCFVYPVTPTVSRINTTAKVHDVEFIRNDIMLFRSTWMG
jgi:peptide/nickel transport system substrate-binding protein